MVPVAIWGTRGHILVDGLLDTCADRTLLPLRWARQLGIDVSTLANPVTIRTATESSLTCRITSLVFELTRNAERVCWLAEVGITGDEMKKPHWGFKGFLEFFTAEFNGPGRAVDLTAGDNLPAATPPSVGNGPPLNG
jgi:hypothetical protein